jgi:hypothetical protein
MDFHETNIRGHRIRFYRQSGVQSDGIYCVEHVNLNHEDFPSDYAEFDTFEMAHARFNIWVEKVQNENFDGNLTYPAKTGAAGDAE